MALLKAPPKLPKTTVVQLRLDDGARSTLTKYTEYLECSPSHVVTEVLNEQTGNLKLAQKFLGHSTIEMTADICTHTSAEAEREAAVALERAIYGELFPVVPNLNLYSNLNFSKPLRPSLHWNLVHLRGYWDQAMGGIMEGKTQQGAKRAAP
jgi:hypothetical protein